MSYDVVGLGVSAMDIVSLVDHFPAGEEVQQARHVTVQGGGPVATAIVTLAKLGASTAMLDSIGDDWCGRLIRDEFQRAGVCTEHLQQVPGASSALATVLVRARDGARTIVYSPATAVELAASEVPWKLIAAARYLHINGRHWQACLAACRYAQDHSVSVSFDGGAHRYRPELRELVRLTDICIVAREFAGSYSGASELDAAAKGLLADGPKLVVITDGARGSWVYPRDGHGFHQPAYLLPEAVDTTGCGDSYHGAFLFGLVRGRELRACARLASTVAALNTRGLGGRGALPTLEKAERFMSAAG